MKYQGPGFYGLNPPYWASATPYQKGQWLSSPADNEIYQRIAAAGTDTADPADDTVKYIARSYERTDAILGANLIASAGAIASACLGATRSVFGVLGVGVRTSVLSVTGRGCIDYLVLSKANTGTSLTEVIVDGRTVLSQSDTWPTNNYLRVIGQVSYGASTTNNFQEARFDPVGVQFRRSLQVFFTATATDTAANAGIAFHLRSQA
jgi:hypothetical protein